MKTYQIEYVDHSDFTRKTAKIKAETVFTASALFKKDNYRADIMRIRVINKK